MGLTALESFREFKKVNGDCTNGYNTKELAVEYAKLKCNWWGSNLVFLGVEEKDNRYFPTFNVFD